MARPAQLVVSVLHFYVLYCSGIGFRSYFVAHTTYPLPLLPSHTETFYVVFLSYLLTLYSIVLVANFIIVFYRITVIGWSVLSCCKPLLSDIIIIIIIIIG